MSPARMHKLPRVLFPIVSVSTATAPATFVCLPVKTREAAEYTRNMVCQPDRRLFTRACSICCRHCKTCHREDRMSIRPSRMRTGQGPLTISRASAFWFIVMVYSNGLKKSFWKRKCASSSFSKKRIDSCLKASRPKKLTLGLL